jgi:peptidyl-prolyl cis-trans isomerase D
MLRGIHKVSSTWLGKGLLAIVLSFMVVSFAIWGIGDIFRGFGRNYAIIIGGTEISAEQFRNYYGDQLRRLSQRLRRPITTDQARALGIDRQLIAQFVGDTALDEQARALRLAVSDAEIVKRITSDPGFRGLNGRFDRARFEELIREGGYSEARFVDEQRRLMLRHQIAASLAGELPVPVAAMTALDRYQNQKRSIEYLALGPAQAGDIAAPTQDALEKYFDEHKALFRAPEYRKITLLALSPAALARPDAVSDADAKKYYQAHQSQYGTPEKREVRQIVFPSEQEAKAAREQIAGGKSFDDIVKERGVKASDTDLGMVTKAAIIDPAIGNAAFALKSGEVSEPVSGGFGTVLVTVGKIEPGSEKSYEQVADEVKHTIAEGQARGKISDLRDKVEDERAAGSTLAETGKKLGLKVEVIDAVDRAGNAPDGKPVPDLPKTPNVGAAAFNSDVGVDNDPLQLPAGGYLYYNVDGITPSRARTLAEVKTQVEQEWRNDQIAQRLKTKSDEMVGKLKEGGTLGELASGNGLNVETAAGLQRGKPTDQVPAPLLDAVFATPQGLAGSVEGRQLNERYIFRVTAVEEPTLDSASAEGKAMASTLQNSFIDDISGEYLAHLERTIGVNINQPVIEQVIGTGGNQ